MKNILKKTGIKLTSTPAHTPESNRVTKDIKRTLLVKARAMMKKASMPQLFWKEAVIHAAYLCNLTSSQVLNIKSPFESFFGTVPTLNKLKVFGC